MAAAASTASRSSETRSASAPRASSCKVRLGREAGLLLQVAQMGRRVNDARSGVRLVLSGQDSQQGRLAAAVGADQARPIARPKLEREPFQYRLGAKPLSQINDIEKNHSPFKGFAEKVQSAP